MDPAFGSGAVKMTPAHDPNDFEVAQRTGLASLNVMTPDASMNDAAPEAFRGMDRFEARRAVVEAFEAAGLLERVGGAHARRAALLPLRHGGGAAAERAVVRADEAAGGAGAAGVARRRVRFQPERFGKIYEHWMENIRDWCISRQLWWGHRIPVWYCQAEGCGETIVAREDPPSCPKCGGAELEQDPDVLDTWFSSWLWPFSTMGWPAETDDLRAFYPGHTLVTAPEILFFWVARMVMAGIEFRGEVPFTDVYFTGTVRDHLGRKMTKSLGNGIDPLVVKERFGADALRYTVISGSGAATDQYLNYENLEETFGPGRNFANKLWNAGRFALMNLGDGPRISGGRGGGSAGAHGPLDPLAAVEGRARGDGRAGAVPPAGARRCADTSSSGASWRTGTWSW